MIGGMYNMPVSTMVQPEIGAQGFRPEKMDTDYQLPVQGATLNTTALFAEDFITIEGRQEASLQCGMCTYGKICY